MHSKFVLKAQSNSRSASKLLQTSHHRRLLPAMKRSITGLHALFAHVLYRTTCLFLIITAL